MLGYICKNNFFVLCFEWLSCFHVERFTQVKSLCIWFKFWWLYNKSSWTENTKWKKKGPLCFGTFLTPLFPGLFQGVTLPFFLSIAFLCFGPKLQPTKVSPISTTCIFSFNSSILLWCVKTCYSMFNSMRMEKCINRSIFTTPITLKGFDLGIKLDWNHVFKF